MATNLNNAMETPNTNPISAVLSKDYEKFYNVIMAIGKPKNGAGIPCFVNYDLGNGAGYLRDISHAKYWPEENYLSVGARGIGHIQTWNDKHEKKSVKEQFIEQCVYYDLEWVDADNSTAQQTAIAVAEKDKEIADLKQNLDRIFKQWENQRDTIERYHKLIHALNDNSNKQYALLEKIRALNVSHLALIENH